MSHDPLKNNKEESRNLWRALIFIVVALLHVFFLFAVGLNVKGNDSAFFRERVIRLSNINESSPSPSPSVQDAPAPPEQEKTPVEVSEPVKDSLAEDLIETDEPVETTETQSGSSTNGESSSSGDVYLSLSDVSAMPVFSRSSVMPVYPPLALRSGIEGTVYLELFINKEGYVLKAVVVQEIPEGKGFGEAAVAAFIGKKCKPAESDGKPVAVHIRYPVRFTIN